MKVFFREGKDVKRKKSIENIKEGSPKFTKWLFLLLKLTFNIILL